MVHRYHEEHCQAMPSIKPNEARVPHPAYPSGDWTHIHHSGGSSRHMFHMLREQYSRRLALLS